MLELKWDGKDDSLKVAGKVPLRLLDFDSSLSHGEKNSGNIIVQGDNLQVMKSLLPFYRGQVKCIYIDPPYNTNATFEHYNDNFPHSDWLSMMYPRLELLREFLSEDGAIFISINDNEQAYLKIICDKIFDRKNFVVNVIWEKKYSPQNDARWLSDSHDFILIYAKDKEIWQPNLLPRTAEMDARYKNPDNDPRGRGLQAIFLQRLTVRVVIIQSQHRAAELFHLRKVEHGLRTKNHLKNLSLTIESGLAQKKITCHA